MNNPGTSVEEFAAVFYLETNVPICFWEKMYQECLERRRFSGLPLSDMKHFGKGIEIIGKQQLSNNGCSLLF